ncbi:DUF4376 domain-containing protein [Aeromonas caviae]
MLLYSKSTGGFYNTAINCGEIPDSVVEITAKYHAELLQAQGLGMVIISNDEGYPVAIEPPSQVRTKDVLRAEVAAKRWHVETGGIVVDGMPVATDIDSQARLNSAYISLKLGHINDTKWKDVNGTFTQITLIEMEKLAQAVAKHIRDCFSRENAHNEIINSLRTQDELDTYDIDTGWPSANY